MGNQCEVTVLVAVYNSEAYLKACLDSLLGQTLRDIQIVCVDDASTDGSLPLLHQYQQADHRVEVVTLTENRGQAHARNCGLALARGRYICFLDSDDWMAPDCLQRAVEVFGRHPRTGCVLFRTIYYYSAARQDEFSMEPFEVMAGYDAFVCSLTWKIHGVYMVRGDIHRQHPYDESAHAFSDDNTTRLHYLASEEVRCCEGVYYYRQRETSVSHGFSLRRFDYLTANMSMKRTLEHLNVNSKLLNVYENHRWLNVIDLYMLLVHHRRQMMPADRALALSTIRSAWASIDCRRLRWNLRCKFGYMPLQCSWFLFRMQEEIYFSLRRIVGR